MLLTVVRVRRIRASFIMPYQHSVGSEGEGRLCHRRTGWRVDEIATTGRGIGGALPSSPVRRGSVEPNTPLPASDKQHVENSMNAYAAILCLVPVFLISLPLLADAAEMPAVGSVAPDFTLPAQDGSKVQLSALHGTWVVLYFYPKDNTPGCTLEAHNFAKDQPEYSKRKAIVLGVSVDSVNSHKEFCAQEGLTFKLLADTEKKVSAAYGSLNNLVVTKLAARHTFIIDPEGKIARVFADVKPAAHSHEVLAALDALAATGK